MSTSHNSEQTQKVIPQKQVSDEAVLKISKEVVVKFIEVGRLSPSNFGETFKDIYQSIHETVRSQS